MKVLNFGSLNLDYVYSVDHMVTGGETLASEGMNIFCGGKGLNQSLALAKAGVPVFHAGMIGEEGKMLLETCKGNGVDITYIRKIPGKSGHAIIQVDKNGQNGILLAGGANHCITAEFADDVLNDFGAGDILLLQNEINLLDYIIDKAYEKKMMIIMNPSPYNNALKTCDLNKISLFLMNEIEGWQLTGEKDTGKILAELRQVYPETKIVLTLGQEGSIYKDKQIQCKQEIFKVKAVDTTAAGDTFTGYFIASVIEKMPISEGLRLAAKASAIAVSRHGASDSIPVRREVREFDLNYK